ncbi:ABC transporter ATP-binding protein [Mesorhizobium sp. GR13]|uniref:ABC transporter ATP-binding protein n=1 Tax=Mesorhizobium sp. GR13 TaxID=2562308 RepID=UPI001FF05AD8|nr:ABC transporter ATP-binding protein [Mesorhizobium sp. GR13]
MNSGTNSGSRKDHVSGDRGSVSLRSVRKSYGSVDVVRGIDLETQPGEFISVLGPSGCGKTTVLRMLAGFEDVNAGDILISGQSVVDLPPHKRDINTVFQSYALFPHMTVAENIAYGPRQRGMAREELRQRVNEALDAVRMAGFADRKPSMLSGGQQQRIALARAIVNRPSVLLLDEPLAALDRKLREEMQVELKLLQLRLGTTFMFVTHDQEEALSMSDRIAVMNSGRIVQIGKPIDIYENPVDLFVAGFIGQQNFFRGTLDGSNVNTIDGVLETEGPSGNAAGRRNVVAAVRPEHVVVGADPENVGHNRIAATLVGLSLLGDHIRIICDTTAGTRILAKGQPSQGSRLTVGQSVWCSFAPNETKVFAEETAT